MCPTSRRTAIVGPAVFFLSQVSGASTKADGSGVVVARAVFRGRDAHWQITLTDKYAAKYFAQVSGITAGSLSGDFRFYDTEIADKEQIGKFMQLPPGIFSPTPSVHPNSYEIALKKPGTNAFHEVVVLFHHDMQPSESLVLFFSIWRNIWNGVPGSPRAPERYAG